MISLSLYIYIYIHNMSMCTCMYIYIYIYIHHYRSELPKSCGAPGHFALRKFSLRGLWELIRMIRGCLS